MDMDVRLKLKELYVRIHTGRRITMNDLAFLADYDKECLNKTINRLVYDEPKSPQIIQLPFVVQNQEKNLHTGRSIDERIAAFSEIKIDEDFFAEPPREEVLLLLSDEKYDAKPESHESAQYTYFNSYEPVTLLNARA